MSWKANTAGLTIFIVGSSFVIGINSPSSMSDSSRPAYSETAYQESVEKVSAMRETVNQEIIERMDSEYGEIITSEQAGLLNCRKPTRMSHSCYHKEVINGQGALAFSPDLITPAVKTFGTLELNGSTYTLETFTGSDSFYITKN